MLLTCDWKRKMRIRPITEFPEYFVSTNGRVFSKWVRGKHRFISTELREINPYDSYGYKEVILCNGKGKRKKVRVHILVLETFVGPRPKGMKGLHKDDNRKNNKLRNLYWGTQKENMEDADRNGLLRKGEDHPQAKLTDDDIADIQELLKERRLSQQKIADIYGIRQSRVSQIKNWNGRTCPGRVYS